MKNYNLVDMHFHTDISFDAFKGDNTFDLDRLIEVFLNTQNGVPKLDILCKTDHNLLLYDKYIEMREKLSIKNIEVLPGIELNGDDSIHWIFIFDPDDLSKKQESNIVGELLDGEIVKLFNYDLSTDLTSQAKKAQESPIEIMNFIKILHKLGITYIAIPHLKKSSGWYDKLKKDPNQLKIIENYLFSNVINGFETKDQEPFIKNNIEQTKNCIKNIFEDISTTDEVTKELNISKRIKHLNKMKEMDWACGENDTALISGSDFHCRKTEKIEDYLEIKKKLFYIKADRTFEGLRISLLDQESRIFSLTKKEKYSKRSSLYIEAININENGKTKTIKFGDGLNTIIGSRGSGKSYILKSLLGKSKSYDKSEIYQDIKIEKIKLSNGDEVSCLDDDTYDFLSQSNDVLSQSNSFENFKNIYNILADAPYSAENFIKGISGLSTKYEKKDEITDFIEDINKLKDKYIEINKSKEIKLDFSFIHMFNDFQKSGANKSKSYEFSESTKKIKAKIREIEDKLKNISSLNQYFEKFKECSQKYIRDKDYKSDNLEKIDYESIGNEIRENIDKENKKIVDFKKTLKVAEISLKDFNDNLTNQENIISTKMAVFERFVEKSIKLLIEISAMNKKVSFCFIKPICKIDNYEILNYDSNYKVEVLQQLDLNNIPSDSLEEMFKKFRVKPSSNDFIKYFNTNSFGEEFYGFFKNKDNRSNGDILKPNIYPQIKFDLDGGGLVDWQNSSPGERANKLLNILLNSNPCKILLIDQPEDNLDNETIYNTVVSKIRELKFRKQIILITHNANIVFAADSEQVIVCQHYKDSYRIISNTIESKEKYEYKSLIDDDEGEARKIRCIDIAAEILDGGKEALRKRIKKIGYKNMFYKEEMDENNIL